MKMKRERMIAAAAGAAGLALVSPATGLYAAVADVVATQEAPVNPTAAPSGEVDAAAVAALVSSINAQVAALPADASQADMEAAVLFAIDQAQQPDAVVSAALAQVKAAAQGKLLAALTNVEKLRGRLAGTGGIGGNGNGDDGDLSFGPQLGGTGGGSTDYTP